MDGSSWPRPKWYDYLPISGYVTYFAKLCQMSESEPGTDLDEEDYHVLNNELPISICHGLYHAVISYPLITPTYTLVKSGLESILC